MEHHVITCFCSPLPLSFPIIVLVLQFCFTPFLVGNKASQMKNNLRLSTDLILLITVWEFE